MSTIITLGGSYDLIAIDGSNAPQTGNIWEIWQNGALVVSSADYYDTTPDGWAFGGYNWDSDPNVYTSLYLSVPNTATTGATYELRFFDANGNDNGEQKDYSATFIPEPLVPPTNIIAFPLDGRIAIAFTPAFLATEYNVQYALGGDLNGIFNYLYGPNDYDGTLAVPLFILSQVENGIPVTFQVSSVDANFNQSDWSDLVTYTPQRFGTDSTPPSAPTNFRAQWGAGALHFYCDQTTDLYNKANALLYMDGQLVRYTGMPYLNIDPSQFGAAAGETHTFTVRWVDYAGNVSADSSAVELYLDPDKTGYDPIDGVTNLTAFTIDGVVALSWNPPAYVPIAGYQVTIQGGAYTVETVLANDGSTYPLNDTIQPNQLEPVRVASSAEDTGLIPACGFAWNVENGVEYTFRVTPFSGSTSFDTKQTASSATASVVVTATAGDTHAAPAAPTLTSQSDYRYYYSHKASGITDFLITQYQAFNHDNSTDTSSLPIQNPHGFNPLVFNRFYNDVSPSYDLPKMLRYQVADAFGQWSDYSNEVSMAPLVTNQSPPDPVTNLTVTAASGSNQLGWTHAKLGQDVESEAANPPPLVFEVRRGNQPLIVTNETSFTDVEGQSDSVYTVRAVSSDGVVSDAVTASVGAGGSSGSSFPAGFCSRPSAQNGYQYEANLNGAEPGNENTYVEVSDSVDTSLGAKAVGASALIDLHLPTVVALVKFDVWSLGLTEFDLEVSNNGVTWQTGYGNSLPDQPSSGGWQHISIIPAATAWRYWRLTVRDGGAIAPSSLEAGDLEAPQALSLGTRTVRIGTFRLYADSNGTTEVQSQQQGHAIATGWRANGGYRFTSLLNDNAAEDTITYGSDQVSATSGNPAVHAGQTVTLPVTGESLPDNTIEGTVIWAIYQSGTRIADNGDNTPSQSKGTNGWSVSVDGSGNIVLGVASQIPPGSNYEVRVHFLEEGVQGSAAFEIVHWAALSALIDLGSTPPGINGLMFGVSSSDVPQYLLEASNNMASWDILLDDPTVITESGAQAGSVILSATYQVYRYWRWTVRDTAVSPASVRISDFRLQTDDVDATTLGDIRLPERRRESAGSPPQVLVPPI